MTVKYNQSLISCDKVPCASFICDDIMHGGKGGTFRDVLEPICALKIESLLLKSPPFDL